MAAARKKRFIYRYSPKQLKATQDTMNNANPSKLTKGEVMGNWIDAANIDYDAYGYHDKMDLNQQGKWVIKFPRGSEDLDKAWGCVIEGIKTNKLWEAKVSPISDEYEKQLICVYTPNWRNAIEIKQIHQSLLDLGVEAQNIVGYKRDEDTRQGQDVYIYDSKCNGTKFLNSLLPSGKLIKELESIRDKLVEEICGRDSGEGSSVLRRLDRTMHVKKLKIDGVNYLLAELRDPNNFQMCITAMIKDAKTRHPSLTAGSFSRIEKLFDVYSKPSREDQQLQTMLALADIQPQQASEHKEEAEGTPAVSHVVDAAPKMP